MLEDGTSQSILLQKLQYNGVQGINLDWFNSYIIGSKQCRWNFSAQNHVPSWENVKHGVPQGSVLVELLFIK
jgi:hypothetical protein